MKRVNARVRPRRRNTGPVGSSFDSWLKQEGVLDEVRQATAKAFASSGNVFADLGFAEPEEELMKAQLAAHIRQIIKRRRLTQRAAAEIIDIDQPKVSALSMVASQIPRATG